MTYKDEDDIFARFAEERREFGFQRDLADDMPRSAARRNSWLVACAVLLAAVAGFMIMSSPQAAQEQVLTTSLR